MKRLRIALTKGRLEKDTVSLLEKMGMDCSAVREKGLKLILPVNDPRAKGTKWFWQKRRM